VGDIWDGVRCVETHLVLTAHIYMSVSAESVPFVTSADDWNSHVPQRPAERTRHSPPTGPDKSGEAKVVSDKRHGWKDISGPGHI
jgi:hypothetical protein